MGFVMQEWLTVIIVLLIVGVLIDGIRRMYQARRNSLRMSLKMAENVCEDIDETPSPDCDGELPNGGARVTHRLHQASAESLNRALHEAIEASDVPVFKSAAGKQRKLSLKPPPTPSPSTPSSEESLPLLMDSVPATDNQAEQTIGGSNSIGSETIDKETIGCDVYNGDGRGTGSARVEPAISESNIQPSLQQPLDEPTMNANVDNCLDKSLGKRIEPKVESIPSILAISQMSAEAPQPSGKISASSTLSDNMSSNKSLHKKTLPKKMLSAKKTASPTLHHQTAELLIIHVKAINDGCLYGRDLLPFILDRGLRYGAMKIFHRHVDDDGEGPVLFSMTNMVVPGTFELQTMETLSTPGISLFLSLPMTDYNSMDAFEMMLTTAKTIANELGGEVNDDQHSIMTKQTIEHYRQRIRNFSLRQQLLERA